MSPPASQGAAKPRGPRVGASGLSPKGRRHEGLEDELPASEAAAAAVIEDLITAGAALIHKRATDRLCFSVAAADATRTLLSLLRLCHLQVDKGEPGDIPGAPTERGPPSEGPAEGLCNEEAPPMPQPGAQDSWAPGCMGIKELTPQLLQQLEADDKTRQQQATKRGTVARKRTVPDTPAAAAATPIAAAAQPAASVRASPATKSAAAAAKPKAAAKAAATRPAAAASSVAAARSSAQSRNKTAGGAPRGPPIRHSRTSAYLGAPKNGRAAN